MKTASKPLYHLLVPLGLLLSPAALAQTTLYVSPAGTDTNPGTLAAPTTLAKAITTIATGGTIFVRGGTYTYSTGLTIAAGNNGSKRIEAYAGETPVLSFSGQATNDANRGFTVNGNSWYIKGLIVERAGDNGIFVGGSSNTFELCTTRFNKDSGLQISRATSTTPRAGWPANNLVLNCTSHDNQDPGNENADGFACKLTSGDGNVFRGCISHHNIDDGWDLYAKEETGPIGVVLIEGCVAYANGGLSSGASSGSGDKNGFKLGGSGIPVDHIVRRSVAFNNGKHGFTDNNNLGSIKVTNNTSYHNAETNFQFRAGGSHVFTNNLSFQGGGSDKTTGTLVGTSNVFWVNNASSNGGGLVVSAADFVSLTVPATVGRNADGTPDLGSFLALAAGSDLINAGVTATGISYNGSAPDLGARESGGTTTPPATTYTLTTAVSPAAGGSITRSPNASSYAAGTVVTLTATPATGYVFAGWSGATTATTAITTVTMSANQTATATFTASTGGGSSTTLRIEDAATNGNGYCGANGSRQNSYTGADNGYYINLSNSAGQGINWRVSVPAAGTYTLRWRYANAGNSSATTARVLVNAASALASVAFPKTSTWSTWTTTTGTVTLQAGANAIRLETTANSEFAIIDWIEVTGVSPVAAACGGTLLASREATTRPAATEFQVYPNPAEASTVVTFRLAEASPVTIQVYDFMGQLVATALDRTYPAGPHEVLLGSKLKTGTYTLLIRSKQGKQSLRLEVR